MQYMNNKNKGYLRFLICKEGREFVAVCLDLDLIEYGKDPIKLQKSIEEAALSYLETIKKENLSDSYLNKSAPEKYWKKWEKIQKESIEKIISKKETNFSNNCFLSTIQQYNKNFSIAC